jgi:hypothetical protein
MGLVKCYDLILRGKSLKISYIEVHVSLIRAGPVEFYLIQILFRMSFDLEVFLCL